MVPTYVADTCLLSGFTLPLPGSLPGLLRHVVSSRFASYLMLPCTMTLISLWFYFCIVYFLFSVSFWVLSLSLYSALLQRLLQQSCTLLICDRYLRGAVTCLRSSTQSEQAATLTQILFLQVKYCMLEKNISEATLQDDQNSFCFYLMDVI